MKGHRVEAAFSRRNKRWLRFMIILLFLCANFPVFLMVKSMWSRKLTVDARAQELCTTPLPYDISGRIVKLSQPPSRVTAVTPKVRFSFLFGIT